MSGAQRAVRDQRRICEQRSLPADACYAPPDIGCLKPYRSARGLCHRLPLCHSLHLRGSYEAGLGPSAARIKQGSERPRCALPLAPANASGLVSYIASVVLAVKQFKCLPPKIGAMGSC